MPSYESEGNADILSRLSRVAQTLNETGSPLKYEPSDACKADTDVQARKQVQFTTGSLIESHLVLADSVNGLAKQVTKQENMFRSLERDSIIAVSALQKHVETSTQHCESQIAALVKELQEKDIHGKHETNCAMAGSPVNSEDYMLKEMAAVREEHRQSHGKMSELVNKLVDEFQHSENQLFSHLASKHEDLEQAALAHRESLTGQIQASVAELYEQLRQSNLEHVSLSNDPRQNDNGVDNLAATIRHEVMSQVNAAEHKFVAAKSRLEAEQQKLQEMMFAFSTQLTEIAETQEKLTQMAETQGRPPQSVRSFPPMCSMANNGLTRSTASSLPTAPQEGITLDDSAAQVDQLGSPRHTVSQSKQTARCVSSGRSTARCVGSGQSDPSSGNDVRASSQLYAWSQPSPKAQARIIVQAATQSAAPPAWQPSSISQVPPHSPSSSRRVSIPSSPKMINDGSLRVPVITQQKPTLQASDVARYVPRGLQKIGQFSV